MESIKHKHKDVVIERINGELVVNSRQIAENFEKDHRVVVRAIENKVISLTEQNCSVERLFIPSTYNHNGNEYREYLLTRDGFTFIVMGFTGIKADTWKLKYIDAFNKMEQVIKEQNSKPLSAMDQLRLQYQVIELHEDRIDKIENQLERLEVSPTQRKIIQKARNRRIKELLGGRDSAAYKDSSFRSRVYSEMGRAFNNYFDIPAYDCTPKNRFSEVLEIIEAYNLSVDLSMELKRLNNQINFEEAI